MKAIVYTITSVLFLFQLIEGGTLHRRRIRNADNVDDTGQGQVNDDSPQLGNVDYPEYGVINLPSGHPADQSNVVAVQDNGPGNQSQRLLQNENSDNNHQSNALFTNTAGGQAVDSGEILGDNQFNSDGSADRNGNGELGEGHESNLNLHSLENGDAEIGINNNDHIEDGEQEVHVDEQHADSVAAEHREHVMQLDIEHAVQNTESTRNEGKSLVNDARPQVYVSVTRSNNMSTTHESGFGILTTASFHLHGRRELPDVEVNRRNSDRQPLLLDASLTGGQTTQARVSQLNYSSDQASMAQHHPFLLEPREGAGSQSSQISMDHESPVQSNPESIHSQGGQQGHKEDQNVGPSPDAENNEPQHEQNSENEDNNHHNTTPVIHTVTLSQGGIIPHEKEENANSEPEVILSNQTYSSTTPVESAHEQNGNEGRYAENHRPSVGQPSIDIPIGNRNYNQSITPEAIDQGQSRHTLNPLIPQTTTTFRVTEHLLTSEQMNIFPTPAIEREREVEYLTTTNTFRTSLSGEFNHESSGSGSDLEGEGSGSENQNAGVECDQNSIVDESENIETDNSEVESSGHENNIDVGNKQNKDGIKHTNCRARSSILQPVLESVTQSSETLATVRISHRIFLQPSVTASELLFTSELLPSILSLSSEGIRKSMQSEIDSLYQDNLESDFSSAILPDIYDYDTDYSPEILSSTTTADFFSSDYHQSSTSLNYRDSHGRTFATETVSDSFMYTTNSPQDTLTQSIEQQFSDRIAILPTAASTYLHESDNSAIISDLVSEIPFSTVTSSYAPTFDFKTNNRTSSSVFVSEAIATSMHLDLSALVKTSGSAEVVPVTSLGTVSLKSRRFEVSTTNSTTTSSQFSSTTIASTDPSTHPTTAVLTTSRTTLRALLLPHSTKMKNPDSTTTRNIHTTKKRVTFKDTEKPETYTSSTITTRLIPPSTINQPIIIQPAPGSLVTMITRPTLAAFKTTKHSVMTTPPQVFLQIWIRMSSCEFYNQKPIFITELQRLIVSEKQVSIRDEQFVVKIKDLPEEYCKDVPNELTVNEETLDQVTVEMYIIDNKGNIDIRLTYDVSSVIRKGFTDASSAFKDKIVRVDVQDSLFNTKPHPAESVESIGDEASVSMVIVLGSVGGCCCVIMVILQVVLIHRRVTAKRKASYLSRRLSVRSMDHVALGVIPKSRPNSGYWNPALSDLDDIYDSKHSHLMNYSELANFCMDVTAIHEEFQTIPCETPDSSVVPIGEENKNRFANVLPYKHTRVKLKTKPGDVSDYINANFVTGYKRAQKAYIVTQSPLVNTVEDFWRMVWEQQSRVILMLNPMMASRKPKQSTCYWPDDLKTDVRRLYGDFGIMLKKRDVHQDYIECTLELMNLETNLKRDVKHFWLVCWPESSNVEPLRFVKYILDSRPHYENSMAPAVVHCGPGQGRSGALIAVDMCMRRFEDKRRVDILDCVFKMRNERAGAVQNKEQYALIYQALNEYAVLLSSPSLSTRSSIITLHAML